LETDQSRFFQNGPIHNNSQLKDSGNRTVCKDAGTEKYLPVQGYLIVDYSSNVCQDISLNLLELLELNREEVVGESLYEILDLESAGKEENSVDVALLETSGLSILSEHAKLYSREKEYDCLITKMDSPNPSLIDCNQLLFICYIPNENSLNDQQKLTDETESWSTVQKSIHKLNNFLTAFYCHWDLISNKSRSDPDMQATSIEVTGLLESASQEVRKMTLTTNNQIKKLKEESL
jgi:hypothetical protein